MVRTRKQALAGLGQANPAGGSLQQTGAEPALQVADGLRQGRRRDRQLDGCLTEAGMPGHAGEGRQGRQQGGIYCEVRLHGQCGVSAFIDIVARAYSSLRPFPRWSRR